MIDRNIIENIASARLNNHLNIYTAFGINTKFDEDDVVAVADDLLTYKQIQNETIYHVADNLTDVHNYELVKWLHQYLYAVDYLDECINEFGYPREGLYRAIAIAKNKMYIDIGENILIIASTS